MNGAIRQAHYKLATEVQSRVLACKQKNNCYLLIGIKANNEHQTINTKQ
jgi:hypothetical protein